MKNINNDQKIKDYHLVGSHIDYRQLAAKRLRRLMAKMPKSYWPNWVFVQGQYGWQLVHHFAKQLLQR